jgi:hypothetical protein
MLVASMNQIARNRADDDRVDDDLALRSTER